MTATVAAAIRAARALVGGTEDPDGSNHEDPVTSWYGWDAAWCAMLDSYVLAHAGFSTDGGDTLAVPGVAQTTSKGWAYVPYLWAAFEAAGRTFDYPEPGDLFAAPELSHTGVIVDVLPGGLVVTVEGNYANACQSLTRQAGALRGFMRPPYDDGPLPPAPDVPEADRPPWPGRVLSWPPVRLGADVATWQARMVARGWILDVDGAYGPKSAAVAEAFQAEKGLDVDGQVGPITWVAAWSLPIT